MVQYLRGRIDPRGTLNHLFFFLFPSQLDIKRSQHGNRAVVATASANTNTYGHLQRIINHTVQGSGCHNNRSPCPSAAFLQFLKDLEKQKQCKSRACHEIMALRRNYMQHVYAATDFFIFLFFISIRVSDSQHSFVFFARFRKAPNGF